MLKLFVLCAIVALAVARPQQFQFPLTFATAPQAFQQVQPQQQQQQQQQQQLQAQPQQQQLALAPAAPPVPLTNPSQVISGAAPDGSAIFGYQTLDGQSRTESVGIDGSVRGSYSYIDANGQAVKINYVADQGGFRTSADPIPVATPGSQPAPVAAPQVQQQAAAPQPQQSQLQFFQFPQQQQQQQAVAAPAPAAPAPQAQAFTPFFSPLPASTLPLGNFGFQQLQAAPAPAPVAAPAPAAAAPQPARHLTPITYSFTTTG